jgi:hypothetical protein
LIPPVTHASSLLPSSLLAMCTKECKFNLKADTESHLACADKELAGKLIRGEPGSICVLTLTRGQETNDVSLTRACIKGHTFAGDPNLGLFAQRDATKGIAVLEVGQCLAHSRGLNKCG